MEVIGNLSPSSLGLGTWVHDHYEYLGGTRFASSVFKDLLTEIHLPGGR